VKVYSSTSESEKALKLTLAASEMLWCDCCATVVNDGLVNRVAVAVVWEG